MGNIERSGYRDLDFSQWHRLIPNLKMIDLDFIQCCKICSKPTLACEITKNQGVKPTTILRKVVSMMGIIGYLLRYKTRKTGYDKHHSELLKNLQDNETKLRELSQERLSITREIYKYCHDNYGTSKAYSAIIESISVQKVHPHESKKTYQWQDMESVTFMTHYRFCNDCKQDYKNNDSREILL